MTKNMEEDPVASFNWAESDSASVAVIAAVAEASGRDPSTNTPLYDVIDPEALERLFARPAKPKADINGCVRFEYEGYRVVVKADGRGYVYE